MMDRCVESELRIVLEDLDGCEVEKKTLNICGVRPG